MPQPNSGISSRVGRRLRVEALEDRRMLATHVVDSLLDNVDVDQFTTLREALDLANANPDADRIEFASSLFSGGPQTLELAIIGEDSTSNGNSALVISTNVEIVGPGDDLLTIDASPLDVTPDEHDGQGARIFHIAVSSSAPQDVSISGVTLTGSDSDKAGGAIRSSANLTLSNVSILENSATVGGGIYHRFGSLDLFSSTFRENTGGGVYVRDGNLMLSDVVVSSNTSKGESGAGVYLEGGDLTLMDSTITDNVLTPFVSGGGGAGAFARDSTVVVSGSTFSSNRISGLWGSRDSHGGGLRVVGSRSGLATRSLTIIDTQFLNNSVVNVATFQGGNGGGVHATNLDSIVLDSVTFSEGLSASGGGAFLEARAVTITDSVFEKNQAFVRDGLGGGLYVIANFFAIADSHFAENLAAANLRGGGGGLYYDAPDNVLGSEFDNGNAEVQVLRTSFVQNTAHVGGGAFIDVERVFESVAIDIVGSTFADNEISAMDFVTDGGGGGLGILGTDGLSSPGDSQLITLRDTKVIDNSAPNGALGGGIYYYSQAASNNPNLISVIDSTIARNSTTGSGGGIYALGRWIQIRDSLIDSNRAEAGGGALIGSDIYSPYPHLSHSIVTNNTATQYGGGILGITQLILEYSNVSHNKASEGGGLYSSYNLAVILNSTFAYNEATNGSGGAIHVDGLRLLQSTLTNNTASDQGGAISFPSSPDILQTIAHSTIVDNHAGNEGGAIYSPSPTSLPISHSILAGNTFGAGLPGDYLPDAAYSHSFIGHNSGVAGLTETGLISNDANGNYVGGDTGGAIDPLLEPLRHNGGPTPTHMPRVDSPVLDAGNIAFNPNDPDGIAWTDDALPFDQRGIPYGRVVDGNAPADVVIDIGAVELQAQPADFNDDAHVDGFDFLTWQVGFGTPNATKADGDADNDADVDAADLDAWHSGYGVAPNSPPAVATASSEAGQSLASSPSPSLAIAAVLADAVLETLNDRQANSQEPIAEAVFASYGEADKRVLSPFDFAEFDTEETNSKEAGTESVELVDALLENTFS
ncbi:right-handed parallel beta-helix repeat-containing protein [Adhaeretor mobilis]|uniref:Uncharacterized protein n=1 Tax=Adhaeretor mobilis TaxID=1930276 RepID=A0A517MY15_9BACT|nr:right-handed parallel beta-helix repeat-containing protein [Adhaeretor mobilis]QDS99772.1 hypothetical protein HG15A2_31030 [Adhaeretor mobilis]